MAINVIAEQCCDDAFIPLSQLLRLTSLQTSSLYQWNSTGFGRRRRAWRKSASLHAGWLTMAERLAAALAGWERQSNRTHVQRSRGRGYCFRRGEPCARACRRHNKRKPEVAADRFAAPLGRGPRKSRQLVEALPRHGTASDTKHSQTAWRPPVSFVSAPASRRPRRILSIDRSDYICRSSVRVRVPSVELVNDARSLIPSVISQLARNVSHLIT